MYLIQTIWHDDSVATYNRCMIMQHEDDLPLSKLAEAVNTLHPGYMSHHYQLVDSGKTLQTHTNPAV